MPLSHTRIIEILQSRFPTEVSAFEESWDMLSMEVDASQHLHVLAFLRDHEELRFNFLTTLCGMHFPDNPEHRRFAVVYHLHNWIDNVRLRYTAFIPEQNPEIDSASSLFLSANWQERETYDFFGIVFRNHPDLKRILNMDEMVSFPLRKEHPLEDGNRTDKNDVYFGRTQQNQPLTQN